MAETSIQTAVAQAIAGEAIDPAYLDAEPVDEMASRYAEVFHYFADQDSPYVRVSNGSEVHAEDGGRIVKLIAKVPGVVRFDGCCSVCGEMEFHTAGWTNDDAGVAARQSVRKANA